MNKVKYEIELEFDLDEESINMLKVVDRDKFLLELGGQFKETLELEFDCKVTKLESRFED